MEASSISTFCCGSLARVGSGLVRGRGRGRGRVRVRVEVGVRV